MPTRITRIHPDIPLCWEDQHTLRFGFDRAILRVQDPPPSAQRMIGALLSGVRSDRLEPTLRRLGVARTEWFALLGVLAPVLHEEAIVAPARRSRPEELSVAVLGPTAVAAPIRRVFAGSGFASSAAVPGESPPGLIVMIERFLPAPAHGAFAFAKDPPRLTIRFGDRYTDVGPLTASIDGPCPGCVALADTDVDPALPTLAAQLIDETPASENLAVAEAAAALAVALTRHWLAGASEPSRSRYRFGVRNGLPLPQVRERQINPHPECGCALTRDGSARLLR